MTPSDRQDDDDPIADTGTFQRFVESEQQLDHTSSRGAGGRWIAVAAIIAIIIIAIVVWALVS